MKKSELQYFRDPNGIMRQKLHKLRTIMNDFEIKNPSEHSWGKLLTLLCLPCCHINRALAT